LRSAFVAGAGFETLLTADYSQIEMRIMAHLSQDAGLIEAFNQGEDLHSFVGARIYGVQPPIMLSRLAKAVETAVADPSALALFTAKGRRNGQRRTAAVRKAGDKAQPNPVKPRGVEVVREWGSVAYG
jgi:hypothetical protein